MLAMGDNRTYGLELGAGQTVQPQPFTPVGDGAGSVFKIFTTAAALDMGMGINAQLDVPRSSRAPGSVTATPPGVRRARGASRTRRRRPRPDERHRCAGAVPEHRVRQADSTGRRPARGGHGGAAGDAVLRRTGQRQGLRPEQQGQPRRLRQTAEPRLVHARPARTQRARIVERRRDPGLGRHVVSAEPDRQDHRPPRPRSAAPTGEVRTSGSRGPRQHAGQRAG